MNRYPDASAYRLRERLAALHGVTMDEVIHGNGSNELLELVVRTFTTPAHHIVFGEPAFVDVPAGGAGSRRAASRAVPLRDLTHDLEAMAAAVDAEDAALVHRESEQPDRHPRRAGGARAALLRSVPEEVIVVMDEAYFEYADAADYPDSLELRGLRERLLVLPDVLEDLRPGGDARRLRGSVPPSSSTT